MPTTTIFDFSILHYFPEVALRGDPMSPGSEIIRDMSHLHFFMGLCAEKLYFLISSEMSFDILSVVVFILAVNIEKQDRERSEKETDLDGKALGKSEKELMVIDSLSYDKIQFVNKLIINFNWKFSWKFQEI